MNIDLIRIDSREPKSIAALFARSNPIMPVLVEELEAGDIRIEGDKLILIERKTPSDLLGSIKDGRLETQITECLEKTPHVALLVDGNILNRNGNAAYELDTAGIMLETKTNWKFSAVWGMLALVQRMGAIVRFSAEDTYSETMRLAHLFGKDVRIVEGRDLEIKTLSPEVRALACLPGIGPKRAQQLIDEFGTPGAALWFLTTPEEDWPDVPGIGKKTQENIFKFMGMELCPNERKSNG